ncbi:metallophosphoesterase [Breznakiella homolactica]|uniref:Metallophosphoesterase n=1 Tax=Breznakiella homolactica TaxID=2798577 RepID=A0A7T7XN96_9SPIR|nr:metallophosphoesterase [Breznakiella homolactica]QQO09413.1 metallophosphoesterase family protein [Breznakiella homolactica]
MVFFTADTHFNHANIIRLCGRPFADVEQMNKTLAQNWNSRVTDRDEIYILGDLIFRGRGTETNEIIKNLNGKKYFIKGNHDKFIYEKGFDEKCFQWIKDYHVLKYEKMKFVLFHYPILEWDGYFRDAVHLYGHIHNSGNNGEQAARFEVLGKRAVNVGVDVNSFYPVSIQTIMDMVK